jgi:hypothetical protein
MTDIEKSTCNPIPNDDDDDGTLLKLIEKTEFMAKQIEELIKKQTLLQDAFYRLYENQRRTERVL